MEFSSGAGGQEAMLFTGELVKMYEKYATFRGWKWEPYELDTVGGVFYTKIQDPLPHIKEEYRIEGPIFS